MIPSVHRPTQARIDLERIKTNVAVVRQGLPKPAKTLAVVKANAYGHGAVAVAQALGGQVDGFCVSNLDEALELRQAGIDQFILILGVVFPEHVPLALAHDLTLTVTSPDWLELAMAQAVDLTGLSIHLKLDTGMGRVGLRDGAVTRDLRLALEKAGARVTGVFTHFATADEADASYVKAQLETFQAYLAQLGDLTGLLIHTSNSAASLWQPETVCDAVRLGVVIYGLNPSGTALPLPPGIQPALSLTSQLIQVKQVPAGQKVGYGSTYTSPAAEVIGTVPIGYADGYIRDLQGFRVLVDGQACPVVGRVSMDQITIRLPQAYPLGTEVVLIGASGELTISATDVADYCKTINYEVTCLISDRVARIYE